LKRILIILAGLAVLGAVLIASIRAGGGKKGVQVYAEAVARGDLQQVVKATGEINPRVKVNISAHVVAKIEKLYVSEGDWIEKGKPFLMLEQNVFTADRDQWAAQLRSAETSVRKQQVALADSRLKLDRARRLRADGIFTVEQMENAQLNESSAQLQLEEARELVSQDRANLLRAQTDLGKTVIYAPISGQVIALSAKEGEVVVSGTMNNPASVIGTIADLSEVLAEVDVDETEIVQVQQAQRALLKVDALPQHVYHGRVTEVGSSGYSRASQPDVTFFKVKILLDDSDRQLRSGMSVRAEIQTQSDRGVLTVPIQAVVERQPLPGDTLATKAVPATARNTAASASPATQAPPETPATTADGVGAPAGRARTAGGKPQTGRSGAAGATGTAPAPAPAGTGEDVKVVFVVAAGKVRQRRVATGISDETHVEIATGLNPGEKVVTGPYRALRDLKDGDTVAAGPPPAAGGGGSSGGDGRDTNGGNDGNGGNGGSGSSSGRGES
jgi:HlyD family secretion protein